MNNTTQPKAAMLLFFLTLLLSLFFAPALRAQVLFEEDFDDFAIGVLPPNWFFQNDGNVFNARACGGNAYEMNVFNGNPSPAFGTPKIDRGNAPGNVVLTFDYRIEDWNDASQLIGTGRWGVFLNQTGLNQTELFRESIAFTDGCGTRTLTFTSFDIGIGSEFDFKFLTEWGSGDWGLSIDNISVTLLNDGCSQATELVQTEFRPGVLTTPTDGTFVGATASGLPNCVGTANDDVWYKFTATERSVGVTVQGGDVVVELYEGGCGALNRLECRNDGSLNELFSHHGTTPGEEYHVRVYTLAAGPLDPAEADFRIQIGTPEAVNDECVSASTLIHSSAGSCTDATMGSFEGATASAGLAACRGTANDDVWYTFVATDPEVSFEITGGDVVVELYEGSCGSLSRIRCQDQFFSGEEFTISDAVIGDTYYLRIYSFDGVELTGSDAEFTICLYTPCLTDPASDLGVSNITATTADLIHSYELLESRTDVIVLRDASPFGTRVFQRTAIAAGVTATGLSPGTDYDYYVVTNCNGLIAAGPLAFSTKLPGDECIDAFSLTQSSATSCGTNLTMGSLENATESQAGCAGTANDDVWYQFEATSTDFSIFLESGDLVVQLFEGGCNNLTPLVCEDRLGTNEAFNFAAATVGQTYYLRVYSFGDTPLTGTNAEFGICVFTTPPVPDNDDCVNATNLQVNLSSSCSVPTSGTNSGALLDNQQRCPGINGRSSVWYAFTASAAEHFVELSNISILNGNGPDQASFQVFTGDCGALTQVQCSGQLQGSNPGPVTVSGLTAGQEYLIRVVPFFPHDIIDFDICITTDCPPLATGLAVTDITATGATLDITDDGEERDYIVVAAGEVPVFGDNGNHLFFASTTVGAAAATGLSSNTAYDFYVGQGCNPAFAGPITFTTRPSCGDVIYDTGGPNGNYGNNEDYTITICPETAEPTGGARRVSLTFEEFSTEGGFDGITIYDGPDTNAPVLTSPGSGIDIWSWDRVATFGSGDLESVTVFTTNASGCITIQFTSDDVVTLPGFKAVVNCDETSQIFSTILTTIPAGTGAVTADAAYLSTASGYMYYVKEGTGSLLALKLGNTQAQVPISGVSLVAGSGATNLGLNGCMAPYTNVPDWWVMNRTWDVVPSVAPAFPVGVRYLYTQEDFDAVANSSGFGGLNHEQLSFYKINGGDEEDLTAAGNECHDMVDPANYQEFDPGEYIYTDLTGGSAGTTAHQAQFEITSFSGGGGGAGTGFLGALPVEFLSFTGEAGPKHNHLSWTTAREENTASHDLERSAEGINWQRISSLPAAGHSVAENNYNYVDETPLPFAYYRVRSVDHDGTVTHSPVIEILRVQSGDERVGVVFPNPARDHVVLLYFSAAAGQPLQLDLLDAAGRRLGSQSFTTQAGRNELRYALGEVPAGLYWMALTDASGQRHLRRVVKR